MKALSALRLPDLKSATAASLSAKTWWMIGIRTSGSEICTKPAFSTYSRAPPPFLARWTKTFLVVAEVFKKDIGCFNPVETCPNLVDLLFSEFVKGVLIVIEAIEKVEF